jgi:hypothetical protein
MIISVLLGYWGIHASGGPWTDAQNSILVLFFYRYHFILQIFFKLQEFTLSAEIVGSENNSFGKKQNNSQYWSLIQLIFFLQGR